MLSIFQSPNKVYVREIRSNDGDLDQGADERLAPPMGFGEHLSSLRKAGRTDQKSHFPPEPRHPGSKTAENPHPEHQQGHRENVSSSGAAAAAARISADAWRANSAILTLDPCELSICHTVHQSGAPKNQPATLLTQEEGTKPKHSREG